VGIVDTGVRRDHPDFAGRDLRTLDIRGSAFEGNDLDGHGTAMAGLIIGGRGAIAPDATVVSVKALFAGPVGSASDLVSGIELALSQGVDVLSLSVGTPSDSPGLTQIVQNAIDAGVVVVAAGDDTNSDRPLFPGALTPVVAVTASNRQNGCLFARLPAWLDVAAPGVDVPTTTLSGTGLVTGSSPATAVCAGVCALLLGLAPPPRRRELAGQLLVFLSSTGTPPTGASGPNSPLLLAPRAAADAIAAWLKA
jgi:thermitase